jgi:hypothetical protein
MSRCDYETGRLDLDLDDEVSRSDLADCLASGWKADEIAEELGLEGADDVARWCAYHDLPLPHAAPSLPPPAAGPVKMTDPKIPKKKAAGGKSEARTSTKRKSATKRKGQAKVATRCEAKASGEAAAERLAMDELIAQTYAAGVGGYTIAKRLSLSLSRVYDGLRRQGVERRSPSWASEHRVNAPTAQEVLDEQAAQARIQALREQAQTVERRRKIERAGVVAMFSAGASVGEIVSWTRMKRNKIIRLLEEAT